MTIDTMPEAQPGDEHQDDHLACGLCHAEKVAGEVVTSLCGEPHRIRGIRTSAATAIENRACPRCITLTGLHLFKHHPERMPEDA